MDKLLNVKEVIELLKKYQFKAMHFHHTWKPDHANFTGSNYQNLQDGMREYHKTQRDMSDIAQHLSVFPDGMCLTGRDFGRNPASIKGYNEGAFAVEFIGNFDKGNDVFEGPQKDTAIQLSKYFDDQSIPVIFHNEKSTKTCPGTSIIKSDFMNEVRAYVVTIEDVVSPWAKEPREWCMINGITDGKRPHDFVSREEVWTMLHRYNKR